MSTFGGKPPEGYDEHGFRIRKPGSFNNPPRMDNRGFRLPPVDGPQPDADGFLQPQRKVHRPFGHLPQYDPNTGAGRPLGEARSIAEFTIVAVGHDALVCTDDGEGDNKILVAKPWQFRRSAFDTKVFGEEETGTTTYAWTETGRRTSTFSVEGSDDVVTVEFMSRAYIIGEKILCTRLSETVDVEVEKAELNDVTDAGTYQADWVDLNAYGREWKTPRASRYTVNAGTQLAADDVQTRILFEDSNLVLSRLPGISASGGVFTVGAELDGTLLYVGGFVRVGDNPSGAGFLAANPYVRVRLDKDPSSGSGSIRTSRTGVKEIALVTDSTDPGGGHAHTHTIPDHSHEPRDAGRPYVELTVGPGPYLVSEGDLFEISVEQKSGYSAEVTEADIWFTLVSG